MAATATEVVEVTGPPATALEATEAMEVVVEATVAVEAAATGPRAVATGWPVVALPMEAVAIAAPLAHLEAAAHPMVIALIHTYAQCPLMFCDLFFCNFSFLMIKTWSLLLQGIMDAENSEDCFHDIVFQGFTLHVPSICGNKHSRNQQISSISTVFFYLCSLCTFCSLICLIWIMQAAGL